MRASSWIRTGTSSLVVVAAVLVGVAALPRPGTAAPVEYVRVCDLFGVGYHYIPGTEVCFNPTENDARQATAGGIWRWRVPNNPQTWARSPRAACRGRLVKIADLTGSSLALNEYARYETTTRYPLRLKAREYIAAVLYKGGFTGVGSGNFCTYYYYDASPADPVYLALGCIDTAPQASVPAIAAFVPDRPLPPPTAANVHIVAANGNLWNVLSAGDIGGRLSIWLCLQRAALSN